MARFYITLMLATCVCFAKAESVKVVYHILSEDGNPVTNAVVKTTTERDRLNMSCNGSCLACAAFLQEAFETCVYFTRNGRCWITPIWQSQLPSPRIVAIWHPRVPKLTCKDMNKSFVDYVIRDYTKPMGVATSTHPSSAGLCRRRGGEVYIRL